MPDLSNTEEQLLADFLAAPERPEGALGFEALHGFLFAVGCAPETQPPSRWRRAIFNDQPPGFRDEQQAEAVTEALMKRYQRIQAEIESGEPTLPAWCVPRTPAIENFADDAPLARWAKGFVTGHEWFEDAWDALLAEVDDDDIDAFEAAFDHAHLMLSFFADRALSQRLLARYSDASVEHEAPTVVAQLQHSMRLYAQLGRGRNEALTRPPAP